MSVLPARSETQGAQSVRRALAMVRAVAQLQRGGSSLSSLAQVTGLNVSTAHRLLRSLTEEGMLKHDEASKCYTLGQLAFELGLAAQDGNHIVSQWADTLRAIASRSGMTTYLMARSDCEAVCLSCVESNAAIRAMPIVAGQRLPLGIGAGSLAILADLGDAEVRAVNALNASRLLSYPGVGGAGGMLDRVGRARQLGFALSQGSVAPGLVGVGVSFPPVSRLTHLALSVSTVSDGLSISDAGALANLMREHAAHLMKVDA